MSEKKQKAKPVPHNRGDRSKSFEILDRIGTGHLRERNCSMFSSLHETQNYSVHRNFLPTCLNPNSYRNRFSSPERQQEECPGWMGKTGKGAVVIWMDELPKNRFRSVLQGVCPAILR